MSSINRTLHIALHAIGILSLASVATKSTHMLWRYFLKPSNNIKKLYNNSDVFKKHDIKAFVIVTGGSDGIGFEIARLFAKEGMNIILIARDNKKLLIAQNLILKEFNGIEVKCFSMDASNADENIYNEFKSFIESDFIAILVNNVGVHNEIPTNVADMKSNDIRRIINVNCTFQVEFTSLIIPKLRQTAGITRKKSLILNISSLTSKMAMPMLSCYAATKAFEDHFTLSLAAELAPDRIDCLCLRPGITVSKMSGIKDPSLFCPSAKNMARSIVNQIDCAGHYQSVIPYFPHCLLDAINKLIPQQMAWGVVREMHQVKRKLILDQQTSK